jgi:hypothetical protein
MMTSDLRKWAESTPEELEKIAVDIWAKKFSFKELRGFQAHYQAQLERLSKVADLGVLDEITAYQHMQDVATRAIDFQQFGD